MDCLKSAYELLTGRSSEFASKNFFTESIDLTYDEFLDVLKPYYEGLETYMENLIFMSEGDLSDKEVGSAILEYVSGECEKIEKVLSESGDVEFTDEELANIGFVSEAVKTPQGQGVRTIFKKVSPLEKFVGGVKKRAKEDPAIIKKYINKKMGIKSPSEQIKAKIKAKGVDLKAKAIVAGEAAKVRGKQGLIQGKALAKKGAEKTKELYGSLKGRVTQYQKQQKRKVQIKKAKVLGKKIGVGAVVIGVGALAIKLATAVRAARKWKKEKCGGLKGKEALTCQANAARMAIDDLKKFRSQECKNRPDPASCEKATSENIDKWTARLRNVESRRRAS